MEATLDTPAAKRDTHRRPTRRLEVGERPACPRGHGGHTVSNGWSKSQDGRFQRPRYLCWPPDGPPHGFTLGRRQPTGKNPHGTKCEHCAQPIARSEGPRIAPAFRQTVAEIAGTLLAVGRGDSLRDAGAQARTAAQRFAAAGALPPGAIVPRLPSTESALAARYADTFGEAVLAKVLPPRWPRLVALDSKPLTIRPYGSRSWDEWPDGKPKGSLLVVAGSDVEQRSLVPWRVALAPDQTAETWAPFLRSREGQPEWVVADSDGALWNAVAEVWPGAQRIYCAWHLKQNLIARATQDGRYHANSPEFVAAIEDAFSSVSGWERVRELAEALDAGNARLWLADNDEVARRQANLFEQFPRRPRSNGAAEGFVGALDKSIGPRRRNFRNARRLRIVLGLLTAQLGFWADAHAYAEVVREALEGPARGWDLEAHHDRGALVRSADPRATEPCSIAAMLLAAAEAREQRAPNTQGPLARPPVSPVRRVSASKPTNVPFRAEQWNRARAEAGLPPLVVRTDASGNHYVAVAGLMLADFPEIAREWDAAAAGRGPEGIRASDRGPAAWRCDRGHASTVPVSVRCRTLSLCGTCYREAPTRRRTSATIASTHPDLVPLWHPDANAFLTPDTVRAKQRGLFFWQCPDPALDHPPYEATIRNVLAHLAAPCPLCRKMRPPTQRRGRPRRD